MSVDDKPLALVTGASRGIGAQVARQLAAKGYHVILTARTEGALEEVEDAIHQAGGTATLAPFDLADAEAISRLAGAIHQRWGRLDALVLNAAVLGDLGPIAHVSDKQFAEIFTINVAANYRLLKAFDPLLRAAESEPAIVGVTSSVAQAPRAYWGPYAASKAALENLLNTYAEEHKRAKVEIYNPGGTATKMRESAFPGEDPSTLKSAETAASELIALIG
ncbi:oxidoreductase [Pacificimonas flava]|uniref:Oxidoreductase n=2 Tax=Pacificimonas TaxID=1960290 RepID=A0A219B8K9_9SPHN|nr:MULTISPECIES: SDR family NAD(P)-dependent oxidoreductase [Pacificimonas]MBZ6379986.1 SDR family NAD(P)-dependent oxidoreductase [Pacificimonas aurantium]OWV34504.1 oxidoreductase [Pacificimonas flava]